jgi:hypothetical protein
MSSTDCDGIKRHKAQTGAVASGFEQVERKLKIKDKKSK